ncbi:MAG: acetyltransferase [Pseudomonadota bacterium]
MTARIVIIGAGGHARVIADIIQAMAKAGSDCTVAGYVDSDPAKAGTQWLGAPVLGDDGVLDALQREGRADHFIIGLGTVRGGTALRSQLFNRTAATGLSPFTARHPDAIVASQVSFGAGCAVMPGAVINTGSQIGDNAIINTRAGVDHDCCIGAHAHIAPGATLSGDVSVGEAALVGVGAVCRQGVRIGRGATLGAGAVAVGDVPDGAVALGVPACVTNGKA